MARTVNRLDRAQSRRLEDFLLTHKEAIESGSLTVTDLVRLCTEKLSLTPSEHSIDSSLTAVNIKRPRSKAGGLTPLLTLVGTLETRITALESRLATLEEVATRPFPSPRAQSLNR